MIRDANKLEILLEDVRDFVRTVAIPNEDRVEREDQIPEEIVEEMRVRGYFGWSIPEEFGGSGLTTEELALANIEISRCSVAFRARVGINTGIGSESLVQDGSEELKRKYLPGLASGRITGCLALTEPNAGSDASAIETTGEPIGNGCFKLNGQKRYITLAPIADVFTVFARTETGTERSVDAITAFLIDRDTEGLSTSGSTPKMGQEGAPIGEVFLKDVVVNSSQIIGRQGGGFRTMMKTLNKQRINLAALATGPAIRLLEEGVRYAKSRRQGGRTIGENQLIQAMLADSKVEIEVARAMILQTARKRDAGQDVTMDVSICKYYATEMAGRVVDRVVQIFGGQGYVKEGGIERFFRDLRALRIYEGTSQIHQLNIARLLLKD
ncbi:MAG: acyl-CoA dehydrogenase [Sphingopyxis sp.]|nr:MAG: acyl-CoA dehydrogenase [Sphingopyxis sp.]